MTGRANHLVIWCSWQVKPPSKYCSSPQSPEKGPVQKRSLSQITQPMGGPPKNNNQTENLISFATTLSDMYELNRSDIIPEAMALKENDFG